MSYSIDVSWEPPLVLNGVLQEYRVLVKPSNLLDNFTILVNSSETSTNVDSLEECSTYSFAVVAINSAGISDASNTDNGTTTSDGIVLHLFTLYYLD